METSPATHQSQRFSTKRSSNMIFRLFYVRMALALLVFTAARHLSDCILISSMVSSFVREKSNEGRILSAFA